jgi:hypothetical protein
MMIHKKSNQQTQPPGLYKGIPVGSQHQKKDSELLVSRYYSSVRKLKNTIAEYYRTKHFRLDITS